MRLSGLVPAPRAALCRAAALAFTGLACAAAAPGTALGGTPAAPSRAQVIEVQHLFQRLGYPLGNKPLGGFGPRTKGAVSYFQRKYGLPVTGRPDARTLALMRSVAASLQGPAAGGAGGAAGKPPQDLVESLLGEHFPVLALAIGLAALLGILALSARERPA